jgi:hypothetical protein
VSRAGAAWRVDGSWRAVKDANVQSGFSVAELIERQSVMLGLNAPAPMTLHNLDSTTPKQTTTDRVEQAIL